jgi:hypothetical protein
MRRKGKGTVLRNQTFKSNAHKVCLSPKKRKAKLLQIAEFHAEALCLAGNLLANQRRLVEVAIARGKNLEPVYCRRKNLDIVS